MLKVAEINPIVHMEIAVDIRKSDLNRDRKVKRLEELLWIRFGNQGNRN